MMKDLFTSLMVTGIFLIQLFWTTQRNLSLDTWFNFWCRLTASSAFRTSRALNILLFPSTVVRKEKANLSLWRSTVLVSKRYNPEATCLNRIVCFSEMCTTKALVAEESIVTRNLSVTRAKDRTFARHWGLYHTQKSPKRPCCVVLMVPPDVCRRNVSPLVLCWMSVNRSGLQKMWSVDSLSKRTHEGLM